MPTRTSWAGAARPGNPGHAGDVVRATAPFGDAVEAIAELLGTTIDDVRCEVGFAHAAKDLDIPGRPVARGTVAGLDIRWIGTVGGADVIEAHIRWTVTAELDPAWEAATAYLIEIHGHPQVSLRIEVLPQDMEPVNLEDMLAIGPVITATPVVNAIPGGGRRPPRHHHLCRPPHPGVPPLSPRLTNARRKRDA